MLHQHSCQPKAVDPFLGLQAYCFQYKPGLEDNLPPHQRSLGCLVDSLDTLNLDLDVSQLSVLYRCEAPCLGHAQVHSLFPLLLNNSNESPPLNIDFTNGCSSYYHPFVVAYYLSNTVCSVTSVSRATSDFSTIFLLRAFSSTLSMEGFPSG